MTKQYQDHIAYYRTMVTIRQFETLAGELFAGKGGREALRAGWGVFLGNVLDEGVEAVFATHWPDFFRNLPDPLGAGTDGADRIPAGSR